MQACKSKCWHVHIQHSRLITTLLQLNNFTTTWNPTIESLHTSIGTRIASAPSLVSSSQQSWNTRMLGRHSPTTCCRFPHNMSELADDVPRSDYIRLHIFAFHTWRGWLPSCHNPIASQKSMQSSASSEIEFSLHDSSGKKGPHHIQPWQLLSCQLGDGWSILNLELLLRACCWLSVNLSCREKNPGKKWSERQRI
jgi:hypothetical protein